MLRLECLKLAVGKSANQQEILAKAQEYVDFVTEEQQAKSLAAQKVAHHAGNAKPYQASV